MSGCFCFIAATQVTSQLHAHIWSKKPNIAAAIEKHTVVKTGLYTYYQKERPLKAYKQCTVNFAIDSQYILYCKCPNTYATQLGFIVFCINLQSSLHIQCGRYSNHNNNVLIVWNIAACLKWKTVFTCLLQFIKLHPAIDGGNIIA